MKKRPILFLLLLTVIVFTVSAGGQQAASSFSWSLALQNVKSGDTVPFSASVQSRTGEEFRLVINPKEACFCYVVAESPGNEVGVVYAGPLHGGETWYSPVMALTEPEGSEYLYIVVSLQEQKNLAQRISALGNGSSSTGMRVVLNEVFRLRSDASRFQEYPEKPVLMGGADRGASEKNQSVEFSGVEFSGLETYVKTISIEH